MRQLQLTIQFIDASHKSQLPRFLLLQWVKMALFNPICVKLNECFAKQVITLRFVNIAESRALNNCYRNKDKPTNVLTFTYPGTILQADIVLCAPIIENEAFLQNKSIIAHYAHLVIHGLLHAQGYDHEIESEALVMESLESDLLSKLSF